MIKLMKKILEVIKDFGVGALTGVFVLSVWGKGLVAITLIPFALTGVLHYFDYFPVQVFLFLPIGCFAVLGILIGQVLRFWIRKV